MKRLTILGIIACSLLLLLSGCDFRLVANVTDGIIDFHPGVYDKSGNPYNIVANQKMDFMGGWGYNKLGSDVMSKYSFALTTKYFTLKSVTVDKDATCPDYNFPYANYPKETHDACYDELWSFTGPIVYEGETAPRRVLSTRCLLNYNTDIMPSPALDAIRHGEYECTINIETIGSTHHVVKMTVWTRPDLKYKENQLNISFEGDQGEGVDLNHDIKLVQEAERGEFFTLYTKSFEIASDPIASNGQYVHVPNGTGNRNVLDEKHKMKYQFNVITAGTYRIKGWVHAASGNDDSFWVKVLQQENEHGPYLWDVFQNTNYQTDYVNHRDVADPVEVYLNKGWVHVYIYLREDGTRLDKIELELQGGDIL